MRLLVSGYILCIIAGLCVVRSSIEGEPETDKCTAMAVGNKGTIDGSTFNTHTADCADCDWRVNKVPAKDWPAGARRPILALSGAYPRQVRNDRGVTWSTNNLEVSNSNS